MNSGTPRKKLIEVAPFLPLDAISAASKADKDKKTGTIKNVHKWFAPMPAPAMRALIFAALVDAPDDDAERGRLLRLVERLAPGNGGVPDQATLNEAQSEILKSTDGHPPILLDPFCGGGSTLVEAQRLGVPAVGSDLNPVPVLITRTLTELIPQVAGRPPLVGDVGRLEAVGHDHFDGLLADVDHYGGQIRGEVWQRVGNLYPPGPNGEVVIAWLWAWTAKCPNPACGATLPMVSSTWLSKRKDHLRWLKPSVQGSEVVFEVGEGSGPPPPPSKVGQGAKFRCLVCGQVAGGEAIKQFGVSQGLGQELLAIVTDVGGMRHYYPGHAAPPPDIERPASAPDAELADDPRAIWCKLYGLVTLADQFTNRQLATLEAFSKAIASIPERVKADGGDETYGRTIASILGLALGKLAQSNSTQVRWNVRSTGSSKAEPAFGRHAMPMVWDFVEVNPFGGSVGDWNRQVAAISGGIRSLPATRTPAAVVREDARAASRLVDGTTFLVTDPPYFDQIGYADLSDYFYVWHRMALRDVHPDLYSTIVTPKNEELIASPYRHRGSKQEAARNFVTGFTDVFKSLKGLAMDFPVLVIYAHRQEESSVLGSASTGWDAMLEAVLEAGLAIEGTLPIHGAYKAKLIGIGTNALASYIVMVCRPRGTVSIPGTIADFRAELRRRLPPAVDALLSTGESMVDIRQAAIGPGMEVYSQFSSVFDGSSPIRVRRALTIINEELGRLLDEHLGVVDDETRWACQWFSDHGYDRGEYDEGRKLAAVFGLGVDGLADAGLVEQGRSKVRLLSRDELPRDWNGDGRTPVWEACQHLVKRVSYGEGEAARLVAKLGPNASGVRELAQYLTNLAIEKGWSEEAIAYDALVKSWPRIEELARHANSDEGRLFEVGGNG